MNRLADEFVHLLTAIATDPDQRLAALWTGAACADTSRQGSQSDRIGTPNAVSPP
jgi:hypothetical protein